MKWFKHYSDASDDSFIEELEDAFGWEGYGRWWKLLEIIASSMEKNDEPSAEHSWVKWQSFLKGKRNKLETFLVHCQDKGKLKLEQNGNILKIICPKLLELRDNHSRSLQVTSQKLAPKNKDIRDKIKESKKDKTPQVAFEHPEVLPETCQAFMEVRKKKRATNTPYALGLITSEIEKLKIQGFSPQSLVEQSIRNSWIDIYPIKDKNNANTRKPNTEFTRPNKTQRLEAAVRRAAESGGFAPRSPSETENGNHADASIPKPENLWQGT